MVCTAIDSLGVPFDSVVKRHSVSATAFPERDLQTIVRQALKLSASDAPLDHLKALFRRIDSGLVGMISTRQLEAFVGAAEGGGGGGGASPTNAFAHIVGGSRGRSGPGASTADAATGDDAVGEAEASTEPPTSPNDATDSPRAVSPVSPLWAAKKAAWATRRASLGSSPSFDEGEGEGLRGEERASEGAPEGRGRPSRSSHANENASGFLKAASARALASLEERKARARGEEEERRKKQEAEAKVKAEAEERRKAAKARARRASALAAER